MPHPRQRSRSRTTAPWSSRRRSAPITVSPPELHNITLPALAAGPAGNAGIAFYATTKGSAKALTAYLAQSGGAMTPDPRFYSGAVNDPAHPIFGNYGDAYSPRADFIGATYDQRGQFWGGFVEQLGPPDSANQIPTAGYVAHLAFSAKPAS